MAASSRTRYGRPYPSQLVRATAARLEPRALYAVILLLRAVINSAALSSSSRASVVVTGVSRTIGVSRRKYRVTSANDDKTDGDMRLCLLLDVTSLRWHWTMRSEKALTILYASAIEVST